MTKEATAWSKVNHFLEGAGWRCSQNGIDICFACDVPPLADKPGDESMHDLHEALASNCGSDVERDAVSRVASPVSA